MHGALIYSISLGAGAYVLGSLPFAVWIGRIFFQTDIRNFGSGNAGATNAWRVLGWTAGLPVLLLDILKGAMAAVLPLMFERLLMDPVSTTWMQVGCGVMAAVGHIFPLFASFKGGKAVATLFGVWLGILPLAAVGSLGVFLLSWIISRYVSLGSVLAAAALPAWVYLLKRDTPAYLFFALFISVLVIWTHRRNIRRLLSGEERRSRFRRRH